MSNTVTQEKVDRLLDNADLEIKEVFGKCTIVAAKLPNGFVLVESSACVDPANYDFEIGLHICLNKIKDKIWELEGYLLQNGAYNE